MKRNKFVQNHVKERYITSFNSIFNSCGLVGLPKFVFLGLSQYLVLYKPIKPACLAGALDEQRSNQHNARHNAENLEYF